MTKLSTILILVFSTLFMNCGLEFSTQKKQNASSTSSIVYDVITPISENPFFEQKVVINIYDLYSKKEEFKEKNNIIVKVEYLASVNNTYADILLPAKTELAVTLDNSCVKEGQVQTSYLRSLLSDPILPIPQQVYTLELPKDIYLSELEIDAQNDICIIGVSETALYFTQEFYQNDPLLSQQEHLEHIFAEEAYALFDSPSLGNTETVLVAVIDSGVDYNHPDLKNVMWKNAQNQHGYDFVNNDTQPLDDSGHGTHVAGLIAAETNNGIGISGVAGKNVKIMAIKSMASESGSITDVINGIYYAVDNGADIINMSLGGSGRNASLEKALSDAVAAGVLVLVAAGNDYQQITSTQFYSPAGYGSSFQGVITVGSVDAITGTRSSFSNYSTQYVELGAPGSRQGSSGLLSTWPNQQYARKQGTSMATPVAAGAVALVVSSLKSNSIDYDPALVEALMIKGSEESDPLGTFFKNGKTLNMKKLSDVLKQLLVASDGGF